MSGRRDARIGHARRGLLSVVASDGGLVELALLAAGQLAAMVGLLPLGEPLQGLARLGGGQELGASPAAEPLGLLQPLAQPADGMPEARKAPVGVLQSADDRPAAIYPAVAEGRHDVIMAALRLPELGPNAVCDALRLCQPALGDVLLVASEVEGALQ